MSSKTHYIDKEDIYIPKTKDEELIVSVDLPDQNDAAYLIFLNKVCKGSDGPSTIGKAMDVLGKKTIVTATVPEAAENNLTSVSVKISEGEHQKLFGPYEFELPKKGDAACFTIEIAHLEEESIER